MNADLFVLPETFNCFFQGTLSPRTSASEGQILGKPVGTGMASSSPMACDAPDGYSCKVSRLRKEGKEPSRGSADCSPRSSRKGRRHWIGTS